MKMLMYEYGLRPLLYALCGFDAERVHGLAMLLLKQGWAPTVVRSLVPKVEDARLEQQLFGRTFKNPVGLAAGLDKHAEALPAFEASHFGSLTIGAVVPRAQPGRPKRRLFALWFDHALINRMGFNSHGKDVVAERLTRITCQVPLIANIGVNTDNARDPEKALQDYLMGIRTLGPLVDICEINISSPNTERLRELVRDLSYLVPKLQVAARQTAIRSGGTLKLLYKLSGDMDREVHESVVGTIVDHGGDGISVINTTLSREGIRSRTKQVGGLSGPPIFQRALRTVRATRALVPHSLPIIGMGGIPGPRQAIEMLKAGANILETLTGFVVQDPFIVSHINRGVLDHMAREQMGNITDFQTYWR
jgi:dihydroorotate dehydrogenase